MFLIRSLYLKKILINKSKNDLEKKQENFKSEKNIFESKIQMQNETVDQLKNIEQKEKTISTPEVENKSVDFQIKSFKNLIDVCEKKKELKIKYELENNLRLVSFKDQKIEISFSSDLEKIFVKELTAKLLEWTNKRWIIAFSKENGMPTLKEQKKKIYDNLINQQSSSSFSKEVKTIFPDAQLFNVKEENDK